MTNAVTRQKFLTVNVSRESVESEAERLLRKARELRAAAEQAQHEVKGELTQKKKSKDAQLDMIIDGLFFPSERDTSLVDRLRGKRCCMDTLENIIVRIDERETAAKGLDVKDTDAVKEAERLEGLVDQLLEACSVLDEEFRSQKNSKGEAFVAHAEEEHWGGGKSAERLEARIKEIRRERSEQFQKRQAEFREAQRIKDDDDHKFQGYNDLSTWSPDDKQGF